MPQTTDKRPVRIGCYSAFLGDSRDAAAQLVREEGANLHYLVGDYLAEITMGLLALRRQARQMMPGLKDIEGGTLAVDYIGQFLGYVLKPLLPDLKRNGTKVITNAGALDPLGCKRAIEELLKEQGIDMKVAAVYGDDMMPEKGGVATFDAFKNDVVSFSPSSVTEHTRDADRLPTNNEPIMSMNAYFGAKGVAAALEAGADIIVTGRVVDSAIVVGPLMYEYGWTPEKDANYHDLLAAASLAGHIIECGAHATGGNFTDWKLAAFSSYGGYANMGYPIVEFESNGEFIVTKPERTGGLVTPATVAEQILYETLDPALYILPDVILDMRQVQLTQVAKDRVHVKGAKGMKPTPFLKCCGIFMDGWVINGTLIIGGAQAKDKAEAVGHAIIERTKRMFKERNMEDYRAYNVEALGSEVSLYGATSQAHGTREVVLRISAIHNDRKALQILSGEILAPVTCMAPGTGMGEIRPPLPNLVHFPCLLPKTMIKGQVVVGSAKPQLIEWDSWDDTHAYQHPTPVPAIPEPPTSQLGSLVKTKLINVAYGRSGEKGDVSNIGIIARDAKFLPYIKRSVTEKVMGDFMKHHCHGTVKMYELPGLNALNFVLTQALGGGALTSLVMDKQGKSFAQLAISGIDVEIPADMLPTESKM